MKTYRLYFLLFAMLIAMPMDVCAEVIPNIDTLRKAAEQGDASACERLGDLYAHGEGVNQDYDEALKWYLKADSDCEKIGDIYAAKHNYTEAAKWYRIAVDEEYNYDGSKIKLGLCYAAGKGVKQSFSEATKLISSHFKEYFIIFSDEDFKVAAYFIVSLLLLLFISFFIYAFKQNKKRFGLSKGVKNALISESLFIPAFSLLLLLVPFFSEGLPLITIDFLMFCSFILIFILSFGLLIISIVFALGEKTKKSNLVSTEGKNETSEEITIVDGNKGHKVVIIKTLKVFFAAGLLAILVGFPYYWFVTKALGHEPLPFLIKSDLVDFDMDENVYLFFVYLLIFLVIEFITSYLLPRLVWGWRNSRMNWQRVYCSKPIMKSKYIKGTLMPTFIGCLILLISPFVNSLVMWLLGISFINLTAFMKFWKLRKEPRDCMIQDMKDEYACFVLDEEQSAYDE